MMLLRQSRKADGRGSDSMTGGCGLVSRRSAVDGTGLLAVLGLLLLLLLWSADPASGGCGRSRLCCHGKNNSCRAEGPRVSNKDSFTCFCDAGCADLADCCSDYREVCNPIDCVLSRSWSEWTDCDAPCGLGSRQRTRQVVVHPENNGKPCQPTTEKIVCEGGRGGGGCDAQTMEAPIRAEKEDVVEGQLQRQHSFRESALIIPANFSRRSRTGPESREDFISGDEAEEDRISMEQHERAVYCARYELTESSPSCRALSADNQLTFGFSGLTHGLPRGLSVCAECHALAMRKRRRRRRRSRARTGVHCRGHGVHLRETTWEAVTTPGCHGKWIMTTRHRHCRCHADEELSFLFL